MSDPKPVQSISVHGRTNVGKVRQRNEDSLLVDEDLKLFLVADGMGGHDRGDLASQTACRVVRDLVSCGMALSSAVSRANQDIVRRGMEDDQRRPMGTTLVAMQVVRQRARLLWVGDSRIYRFRDRLERLSRDHSAVQQLIDLGEITEAEARHHPHRNIITQALGASTSDDMKFGTREELLLPGDRYLLCSDGLTTEVEDASIGQVLQSAASSEETCSRLIDEALESGGSDNITAIVVDVAATD